MAVTIRIKRRAPGGAVGAPAALKTAELAHNDADDTLYYGFGDDGAGNATTVKSIGGAGAFVTHDVLDDALANTGAGDMLKSVYDPNDNGKVTASETADSVDWGGVQNKQAATSSAPGLMSATDKQKLDGVAANANAYVHPTTDGSRHVPTTDSGDTSKFLKSSVSVGGAPDWATVSKSDVGLGNVDNTSDADKPISSAAQAALNGKAALDSPALTGTPTAPTPPAGTNTAQLATTAFVTAAVAALIDGAPGAIDTLNELAAAINDDPNFAATITGALADKLAKSANLSDLTDTAEAWANLGGGSLGRQNANAVSISGGTINGVELDGGTF